MADTAKSKFGMGLVLGAIIGGLGALFLSPKSGKENRKLLMKKIKEFQDSLEDMHVQEKVKEIFGDVTDESIKLYKRAKKDLAGRLDGIRDQIEDFDHEQYVGMVEDIMEDIKGQVKASSKHLDKLKGYLLENWNVLTEETEEPEKKKTKNKS